LAIFEVNGKKSRPRPMYRFIAKELKADIISGVYADGAPFPSEADLQNAYDVSRVTVRSALKLLEQEGLIKRRQGSGTVVSGRAIHKSLDTLLDFHREATQHLRNPRSQVLSLIERPSRAQERLILGLQSSENLIELKRLRFLDEDPVVLQTTCLPRDLMQGVEADDLNNRSLYDYLKREKYVQLAYADSVLEPYSIDKHDATWLKLAPGAAVMRAHRTAVDQKGRTVEYSINLIRGDYFKYSYRLMADEMAP
jgi:GntR family transcriptional regulator